MVYSVFFFPQKQATTISADNTNNATTTRSTPAKLSKSPSTHGDSVDKDKTVEIVDSQSDCDNGPRKDVESELTLNDSSDDEISDSECTSKVSAISLNIDGICFNSSCDQGIVKSLNEAKQNIEKSPTKTPIKIKVTSTYEDEESSKSMKTLNMFDEYCLELDEGSPEKCDLKNNKDDLLDLHDSKVPRLTKHNEVLDLVLSKTDEKVELTDTCVKLKTSEEKVGCLSDNKNTVDEIASSSIECPPTVQHSDDNQPQTGCTKSNITASETVQITSHKVGDFPCKTCSDSFSSVSILLDHEQRCCEDMQSCGSKSGAQENVNDNRQNRDQTDAQKELEIDDDIVKLLPTENAEDDCESSEPLCDKNIQENIDKAIEILHTSTENLSKDETQDINLNCSKVNSNMISASSSVRESECFSDASEEEHCTCGECGMEDNQGETASEGGGVNNAIDLSTSGTVAMVKQDTCSTPDNVDIAQSSDRVVVNERKVIPENTPEVTYVESVDDQECSDLIIRSDISNSDEQEIETCGCNTCGDNTKTVVADDVCSGKLSTVDSAVENSIHKNPSHSDNENSTNELSHLSSICANVLTTLNGGECTKIESSGKEQTSTSIKIAKRTEVKLKASKRLAVLYRKYLGFAYHRWKLKWPYVRNGRKIDKKLLKFQSITLKKDASNKTVTEHENITDTVVTISETSDCVKEINTNPGNGNATEPVKEDINHDMEDLNLVRKDMINPVNEDINPAKEDINTTKKDINPTKEDSNPMKEDVINAEVANVNPVDEGIISPVKENIVSPVVENVTDPASDGSTNLVNKDSTNPMSCTIVDDGIFDISAGMTADIDQDTNAMIDQIVTSNNYTCNLDFNIDQLAFESPQKRANDGRVVVEYVGNSKVNLADRLNEDNAQSDVGEFTSQTSSVFKDMVEYVATSGDVKPNEKEDDAEIDAIISEYTKSVLKEPSNDTEQHVNDYGKGRPKTKTRARKRKFTRKPRKNPYLNASQREYIKESKLKPQRGKGIYNNYTRRRKRRPVDPVLSEKRPMESKRLRSKPEFECTVCKLTFKTSNVFDAHKETCVQVSRS